MDRLHAWYEMLSPYTRVEKASNRVLFLTFGKASLYKGSIVGCYFVACALRHMAYACVHSAAAFRAAAFIIDRCTA